MASGELTMVNISTIDQTVSEQGQFCLLDWLLQNNGIAYAVYEDWRYGRMANLESAMAITDDELQALMEQAQKYCQQLKLVAHPQEYFCWSGEQRHALHISANQTRHQQLGQRWLPPQDAPQLDLFMDNSATIAENTLLALLADRRVTQAQTALRQLAQFNTAHPKLGGYQDLINYALHAAESPEVPQDALLAEVLGLDHEVVPLAKELLGAQQRDFLAAAWRRLAAALSASAVDLPSLEAEPRLHYSYALQQIPDWAALHQQLSGDANLYQSPHLLARFAQACWHHQQTGLSVWLWGLLFERFSSAAETLLATHGRYLLPQWDNFLDFDQDWPTDYFLGFLLIQQPGLIHLYQQLPRAELALIQLPANQALYALITARLANADEKSQREMLQRQSPALLRCYLAK